MKKEEKEEMKEKEKEEEGENPIYARTHFTYDVGTVITHVPPLLKTLQ